MFSHAQTMHPRVDLESEAAFQDAMRELRPESDEDWKNPD
jgi:hypothetical protein